MINSHISVIANQNYHYACTLCMQHNSYYYARGEIQLGKGSSHKLVANLRILSSFLEHMHIRTNFPLIQSAVMITLSRVQSGRAALLVVHGLATYTYGSSSHKLPAD